MKIHYKFYMAIIAICISSITLGQKDAVIKIGERDQDGKSIDKETGEIKEAYINNKIVDINSILDITLDKTILISKTSKNAKFPVEISEKVTKISEALKKRKETLQVIDSIIRLYSFDALVNDEEATKKYFSALGTAVKRVDDIARIDPRINDKALDYDDFYTSVYFAAEDVLNELTQEVEKIASENGVYVQFGGWIVVGGKQTALNIPGFDEIKPQEAFEVDRWQMLPSPKQLAELKELQKIAKENEGKEDEILKNIAKNHLDQLRTILDTKIRAIQNRIDEEIEKIKDLDNAAQIRFDTLVGEINEVKRMIKDFKQDLNLRKEYYTAMVSNEETVVLSEFLSKMETDIKEMKSRGKLLLDKVNSVSVTITAIGGELGATIQQIKMEFEDLKDTYTNIYNTIKSTISDQFKAFLYGEKLNFAALKYSAEVYKFTLDKLPEATSFDLINSGVRKDGDQLAFKLEVSGKDGVIYSENRKVFMFRVLPHIEGTVGVIFADPLANTAVQTQFQLAPYYNVIFKGFLDRRARRKSITYNRIFDWGIGLHVSAPDFDGDDVPELGTGIVISGLNDYVQTGIAINVFTGDPYWFFGLRLPVPTFNIGASPNNN